MKKYFGSLEMRVLDILCRLYRFVAVEESDWIEIAAKTIVAKEFKLKKVQFVSDLIEPGHDAKTIEKQIKDINFYHYTEQDDLQEKEKIGVKILKLEK
jgi:hypothetical protein